MIPNTFTRFAAASAMAAALAGAGAAHAATYFVSPCGQDAWLGLQPGCMGPLGPKRTIQAAINAAVNGDTVLVLPGTYVGTIDLDGKAITLTGSGGAAGTIIDGAGDGPVVLCNSLEGPSTIIEGFTIQGGRSELDGGGMLIALASPIVRECVFDDNRADRHGGGIASLTASPQIIDCEFLVGRSGLPDGLDGFGAGVYLLGGAPEINGCTFTANFATTHGGGVAVGPSTLATIEDCHFNLNAALGGDGGAMWVYAGEASVSDSVIMSNNTTGNGGGAAIENGGEASFVGCTFEDNGFAKSSTRQGAAVWVNNASASFLGCGFEGNTGGEGGAIFAFESDVSATLCGFTDNTAILFGWGLGGAIRSETSTLEIGLCTFTGNRSYGSGGAISVSGGTVSLGGSTFTGNYGDDQYDINGDGGAVDAWSAALTVTGCAFNSNLAPHEGGGLSLVNCQDAQISSCTFNENSSAYGGGMHVRYLPAHVTDCEFTDNSTTGTGAGAETREGSSSVFRACVFSGNEADAWGGGMLLGDDTIVEGCSFVDNAAERGGGAAVLSGGADALLIGCEFDGNSASESGGAICLLTAASMRAVNCVVTGNTSPFGTGAVHARGDFGNEGFDLTNCVVANNTGGGVIVDVGSNPSTLSNSIAWGNTSGSEVSGADLEVFHSNVEGGAPGPGNINSNPMFVNAVVGNYRLQAGSPCIDTGMNARVPLDAADLDTDGDFDERTPMDFDGAPRFMDNPMAANLGCGSPAIVDMGAFESAGAVAPSLPFADLNGDGVVNSSDLAIVLATWGVCQTDCCPGDLNLDGVVDSSDLAQLLGSWG